LHSKNSLHWDEKKQCTAPEKKVGPFVGWMGRVDGIQKYNMVMDGEMGAAER